MPKHINDIGEFGFIHRFAPNFEALTPYEDEGIGDDCALLTIDDQRYHLVSTDMLVEDVHFIKDDISPYDLGYKSLAVNLSDIAAMGGKALYSFLSISIPPNTPLSYLDAFMEGYHALSTKYKVALMGGDTTRSNEQLCINVCVVGESPKSEVKRRSMAQNGDIIAVTGHLGDSAAGLKAILEKTPRTREVKHLINKHYRPKPQLKKGLWLAQQEGTNAMMDISDGISSDIKHILTASTKGANINSDQLPISESLTTIAHQQKWKALPLALSGGEDYELLVTIAPNNFEEVQKNYFNTFGSTLYPIGKINSTGRFTLDHKELTQAIDFKHFE